MTESEEPLPDRRRYRTMLWAAAGLAIVGLIVVLFRDSGQTLGPNENPPGLRDEDRPSLPDCPNSDECREFLQGLDAGSSRPSASNEQVQPIVESLKLEPKEAETLAQSTFTLTDAEYLADCFLIRDVIRSLALKNDRPLTQAERCFDWICRETYLSMKRRPPAPPWWVLQAGAANGIDRANIFLAMMRQLGLDACLVGPGQLGAMPCAFYRQPGGPIEYVPVRAVGVRIGKDIFLFDPWQGKPISIEQKTATLAQIKADPQKASAWLAAAKIDPKEVNDWQVFVAAPAQAVSPRMAWLEKQMPASADAKVHTDLLAMVGRFKQEAGVDCRVLNASGGPYALVHLFDTFYRESKRSDLRIDQPEKEKYRESQFPNEFIPVLHVGVGGPPLGSGSAWVWLQSNFRQQLGNTLLKPKSGRDRLLRGDFTNAILAFSNARFQEGGEEAPQEDVDRWAEEAVRAFAALVDPKDPLKRERANAELNDFLKSPATEKVANKIRYRTSHLLSADAAYEIALAKHEQAERAHARWLRQPDDKRRKEDARKLWGYALDAWRQCAPDPELKRYYKDRDEHAERQKELCHQRSALLEQVKAAPSP